MDMNRSSRLRSRSGGSSKSGRGSESRLPCPVRLLPVAIGEKPSSSSGLSHRVGFSSLIAPHSHYSPSRLSGSDRVTFHDRLREIQSLIPYAAYTLSLIVAYKQLRAGYRAIYRAYRVGSVDGLTPLCVCLAIHSHSIPNSSIYLSKAPLQKSMSFSRRLQGKLTFIHSIMNLSISRLLTQLRNYIGFSSRVEEKLTLLGETS